MFCGEAVEQRTDCHWQSPTSPGWVTGFGLAHQAAEAVGVDVFEDDAGAGIPERECPK